MGDGELLMSIFVGWGITTMVPLMLCAWVPKFRQFFAQDERGRDKGPLDIALWAMCWPIILGVALMFAIVIGPVFLTPWLLGKLYSKMKSTK